MAIITRGGNGEKKKIGENGAFRSWLLLPLLVMTAAMMARPETAVAAARDGLTLWARAVAPALLPFFILSEMMIALGGAELLGRRLTPLMGPLFALPGTASLAVALGFCSGFPTGAMVTAALRRQGAVSAEEGGRLLAFTNNAGPLYVTAAVSSALLGCPEAAWLLAAGHYGINLLLGIALGRLHQRGGKRSQQAAREPKREALPLSALMKAAAQRAAANLMLIGCYMAFFSVAAALLTPEGLAPLPRAAVSGILEMSLGINALAESGLPPDALLPLVGAELALGGASVQLQVLAMTADTDISPRLYLLSRPLHAALAFGFTRAALKLLPLRLAAAGGDIIPMLSAGQIMGRSLRLAVIALAGMWLMALLLPDKYKNGG